MSDFCNYAWTTFEKSFESTSKSGGLGLERGEKIGQSWDVRAMPQPDNVRLSVDLVSLSSWGAEGPSSPHAKSNYGTRGRPSNRLKSKERERGMERGRMRERTSIFSRSESAQRVPQPNLKWKSAAGPRDNSAERRAEGRAGRNADKLIKKSPANPGYEYNLRQIFKLPALRRGGRRCWLRALPDNEVTLPEAWLSRRK